MSQEVQVVKGFPAEWGACSRTVLLDGGILDLSFWNNTIAVGSTSSNIIILNVTTGGQEAIFSGHDSSVISVTYSSDGVFLVSGSYDETVKLWDVQTGGVVKTFHGHTGSVISVSISADCTRIASGSWDGRAFLWDIQTGKFHCIIQKEGSAPHVSFFPSDPQHLLSVCDSIDVQQWDINGHQVGLAYNGSSQVAFSPDGTQFVLYFEGAILIRNSSSGLIVTEFQTDVEQLDYICFSPNGRLIAAASCDGTYVWDITGSNPCLIETFPECTSDITSLEFSSPSSLILGYNDCSIKFWQIGSSSEDLVADPITEFFNLDCVRSITLQAKDDIIITSESNGMVRTWDISTSHCKASFQTPVKISYCTDTQLIAGKLILGWYQDQDKKIRIWDVEKGKLLLAIEVSDHIYDLKISEDGSRVFCKAKTSIQAWSIQTGERVGIVGPEFILSDANSIIIDGSRVWVHFHYIEDMGWDFGTPGSLPIQLPNTSAYRLHPNGIMLWDTGSYRVEDTETGEVVFQLPGRYEHPHDVQWNGPYLVALFSTMGVLVLDFSHIF